MKINYKQVVIWDATLIDVGFLGSEQSVPSALRGLAASGVKITTGAPTATVGQWIPGAKVTNAVDGTFYINTGTTAAPVWSIGGTITNGSVTLAKLAAGISPSHIIKFGGTASGGTTATRAYSIPGVVATDVAICVIRASTNAASIQKATLTTDTLTILFSTDPGAGTTVDYQIARAAV